MGEGISDSGSEFQDGGVGAGMSSSSLEHYIFSAREALGVDSYYSR